MTQQDLEQLAQAFEENTLTNADWDEGGGYRHEAVHCTFEAGFKKALELVFEELTDDDFISIKTMKLIKGFIS